MTAQSRQSEPRTIVDKIWTDHVVSQDPGSPVVIAVDLHLVHEVTSPQAFTGLREHGLTVRRLAQTVAADHSIPTTPRNLPMLKVVRLRGDEDLPFDVDPFARLMLLAGTDELGYLLGKLPTIEAWEAAAQI